jgi:hypothetical protein
MFVEEEAPNMTILDFKPKGDLLTTVAVGAAVVAVPVVIPLAWSAARPLLKAVFKGGLMLYESGRGAYAAAADWTGSQTEKKATAVKPKKTEARAKEREQRALAQNLGLVEEQSVAAKPARPKPRRAPKSAGKITEPRT